LLAGVGPACLLGGVCPAASPAIKPAAPAVAMGPAFFAPPNKPFLPGLLDCGVVDGAGAERCG
jgi:hypothetical protein